MAAEFFGFRIFDKKHVFENFRAGHIQFAVAHYLLSKLENHARKEQVIP